MAGHVGITLEDFIVEKEPPVIIYDGCADVTRRKCSKKSKCNAEWCKSTGDGSVSRVKRPRGGLLAPNTIHETGTDMMKILKISMRHADGLFVLFIRRADVNRSGVRGILFAFGPRLLDGETAAAASRLVSQRSRVSGEWRTQRFRVSCNK
jgi:hypothetical protein